MGASNGDEPAIRRLVEQYLPRLTRTARRMGARDAEGVANGVLFRVLRTLDRIERLETATFRAILFRSLKNAVIDERRATAIRPATLPLTADPKHGAADLADQDDAAFTAVEDRDYVEGLLESLKAEQRDVLRYRFLQDLSVEETATLLGRSSNATRQLQHRALRALRATILAAVVLVLIVLSSTRTGLIETIGPAGLPSSGGVDGRSAPAPDGGTDQRGAVSTSLPPSPSSNMIPTGPVRIRHAETGWYLVAASSSEVTFAEAEEPEAHWTITDAEGSQVIESLRHGGLRLADDVVLIRPYADEAGSASTLSPLGGFVIRSASSGSFLAVRSEQPRMTRDGGRSARWIIESASVGGQHDEDLAGQVLTGEERGLPDPTGRASGEDQAVGVLCATPNECRTGEAESGWDGGVPSRVVADDPTSSIEPLPMGEEPTSVPSTDADADDLEVTLPAPSDAGSPSDPVEPPIADPDGAEVPLPPNMMTPVEPPASDFSLRFGHSYLCIEVQQVGTEEPGGNTAEGTDGIPGTDGVPGTDGADGADGSPGGSAGIALAVQATCDTNRNQVFNAHDVGDGQVELVSVQTGNCLQVAAGSAEQSTLTVESLCGNIASRWILIEAEATSPGEEIVAGVSVKSALNGHCLDLPAASQIEGEALIQLPCNGALNQLFLR